LVDYIYLIIYSMDSVLLEKLIGSHLVKKFPVNFMVTPCINNAETFYYQLMHIMLKNTELLKYSKIT